MKFSNPATTQAAFSLARTAVLSLALLFSQQSLAAPSYPETAAPSERDRQYQSVKEDLAAKNYQAAIAKLQGLIEAEPKDADAYNLMGYSHRKLKHYEEAERHYRQALTLDPEHRGALNYIGQLYVETGRPEQAQEMLSRLDKACFFGCEEYRELKTIVESAQPVIQQSESGW